MSSSTSLKEICIDLTDELNKLPTMQSGHSIYRVHSKLRDVNPHAYEPTVVAIGPYHRDNDRLKLMEEHKRNYLRSLLQRNPAKSLEMYYSAIAQLEDRARGFYAEPINMSSRMFTSMLLTNGCFILEMVQKLQNPNLREDGDMVFNMDWVRVGLKQDLVLFENQIPFFILCELWNLIVEVPDQHNNFMDYFTASLSILYPREMLPIRRPDRSPEEIKHLLDFMHKAMLPSSHLLNLGECTNQTTNLHLRHNASELRMANVRFKRKEGGRLFDLSFEKGTLFLAPLVIDDATESFFKNLIAYEQYLRDSSTSYVTNYLALIDQLIDSSSDVQILSNCQVITNLLGDDDAVANMLNKLADSVVVRQHFVYAKLIEGVNIHCDKFTNKMMAKLRRSYWNSPWVLFAIGVATIIFLLTGTQTVFTIIPMVSTPKGPN